MRLTLSDVLAQLRAEGLAPTGADDAMRSALARSTEEQLPWYLRAVVGLGAWVATAFLLGFLFEIDVLKGDTTRIIVGALLVSGAVWLRREETGEFLRQLAVAASLAGQGLVVFGIGEALHSPAAAGVTGVVLSVVLVWLMPDRLHRFLSAVIGSVAALAAVVDLGLPYGYEITTLALVALAAYIWRVGVRVRDERTAEMLEPVGYGLVVALFGVLLFGDSMVFSEVAREIHRGYRRSYLGAITTVGITIALAALVSAILEEHRTPRGGKLWVVAIGAILLLGAATLSSPGIVAGATVLVLGFDRRNPVLIALAVMFLLVFGSVYYYSLSLTLLEKSGVLAASGVLLLALRWYLAPRSDGGLVRP
jgi:hypothetical protein